MGSTGKPTCSWDFFCAGDGDKKSQRLEVLNGGSGCSVLVLDWTGALKYSNLFCLIALHAIYNGVADVFFSLVFSDLEFTVKDENLHLAFPPRPLIRAAGRV